ncbi:DNA cytosine methyltransferase [Methanocorpusculum sp.]|nr:DNA cytosine methyltransferase [Methanocorpusculum sp.]
MNSRLVEMIARGRLPLRGGQWIDAYNQTKDADCAGTIIAGINAKNHYFIMEEAKEPIVLGWTRDEKGNVTDRHPVDVANAVTAAKRDNTQNYVIEQRGHGFVQSSQKKICLTITGASFKDNNTLNNGYRIRKLTPRECFRLMGVSDADIDKIQAAGISKSQQYKMAGNSIVVNTLAAIFRQLFIGNFNKVIQTEIF